MKFTDNENQWINAIFRYLYGNHDLRMKNRDLILNTFFNSDLQVKKIDEMPSSPQMRAIIHHIRNEILPVNAGQVVRCENLKELPESYKKGCFWLDATSSGYEATCSTEKIMEHVKTLKSRIKAIEKDIESAYLICKAITRLEREGWKDESK